MLSSRARRSDRSGSALRSRRRRSTRSGIAGGGRRRRSASRGRACKARRPVPRSCPWALSAEEQQRILRARERTNWGPMRLSELERPAPLDERQGPQAPWRVAAPALPPGRRRPGALSGLSPARCCTSSFQRGEVPPARTLGHRPARHRPLARSGQDRRESASKTTTPACSTASCTAARTPPTSAPACDAPPPGGASRAADPSRPSSAITPSATPTATRCLKACSPSWAPATSAARPTAALQRQAGTTSGTPWTANGHTAKSGPTAPAATAPQHPFIRYHNRRRPHSAAGGRPPITRVQQVHEHDS